ncbi:helix-turn-helix domain-containing protein [Pseudomonas protegens]|uniref:helix-turn-helix domain-containing protein n=1 Tax=Pseudomonas protegens TaxID=380021 RepID=UPI001C8DCADE|nr:helix-turn-helix transcriptional regulator [Pseudomonas protegens]QZI70568.1 helix-turn-helix domain-containing protein [Pseudomonas protegens]
MECGLYGALTVKRYESGETQPSLEVLKKVAVAFNVTTDWLVFEEGEREPQNELKLKFEAVAHMDEEERRSILDLLDAMILKHQTKRFFVPNTGPMG